MDPPQLNWMVHERQKYLKLLQHVFVLLFVRLRIKEQEPKINNKRVISMEGTFLGTPYTPGLPWLCVMVVQEPEGECIIGHVIPKHKLWA